MCQARPLRRIPIRQPVVVDRRKELLQDVGEGGRSNRHPGSGNAARRASRAEERFGRRLRDDQRFRGDWWCTRRSELPVVAATAFGIDQRLVRFASALKRDWRGARSDIRVVASRQRSKGAPDRLLVSAMAT
jgi:hypothetical protein